MEQLSIPTSNHTSLFLFFLALTSVLCVMSVCTSLLVYESSSFQTCGPNVKPLQTPTF